MTRNRSKRNNQRPVVKVTRRQPKAAFANARMGYNNLPRMSKSNAYLSKQAKTNSFVNKRELNDVPLGTSQRNGFNKNSGFKIVEKDEYIGEVTGTVAFDNTAYAVNPGQATTFPWLAIEALQWEKYQFLYLEFYLKPEVTQYTTYANSGKVILSFDADASDAAPASKKAAEDTFPMCDGMPYQTESLVIPSFILNSHLDNFYVRPGNLPGGADIKTYDLGNLFVSTMGQGQFFPNMMELRVRYKCKLMIPVLETIKPAPKNNSVSQFFDVQPGHAAGEYGCIFSPGTSGVGIIFTDGLNWQNTNDLGIFIPPAGNYLIHVNTSYDSAAYNFGVIDAQIKFNADVVQPDPTWDLNVNTYKTADIQQTVWLSFDGVTDTFQVVISASLTSLGTWDSVVCLTIQAV